MNRIQSYLRHNKIKVIGIIIAIILGFSLIRVADNMYAEQGKSSVKESAVTLKTNNNINITRENSEKLINEFLKNATEGNYSKAYTYLSKECKENLYPTEDDFIKDYCKDKKIKGKNYLIEQDSDVSSYTYKICLDNKLSTGSTETNATTDYYTIAVDNGEELKLNINMLLTVEEQNVEKELKDTKIIVKSVNLYLGYKEAVVSYSNNSNKKITIGSGVSIKDNNNNEISQTNKQDDIVLNSNEKKEIKYRFNTRYDNKIKQIYFKNIDGEELKIDL